MLAKVSNDTVNVDKVYGEKTATVTLTPDSSIRPRNTTFTSSSTINIRLSTNNGKLYYGDRNGNAIKTATSSSGVINYSENVSNGTYRFIGVEPSGSSTQTITYSYKIWQTLYTIQKPTSVWKGKIRNNNQIGVIDGVTLLGVHTDGTRKNYE